MKCNNLSNMLIILRSEQSHVFDLFCSSICCSTSVYSFEKKKKKRKDIGLRSEEEEETKEIYRFKVCLSICIFSRPFPSPARLTSRQPTTVDPTLDLLRQVPITAG